MLLKACPARKVTAAHAEMTVAQAVALQALLVPAVVTVVAHKAAVAVVTVAARHPRPQHQPRHKLLLFQLTPSYRT